MDEPEGGDPACWAHLFADETAAGEPPHPASEMVDLAVLAQTAAAQGAAWTHQSADLHVNLVVFAAGQGVAEHVNHDVDVLVLGIAGDGIVSVDGTRHMLRAGHALVIPKGALRRTQSLGEAFAYLTCHRRRGGLWPSH